MIYVFNFATVYDVEAERDDPSLDLDLMASPQLAGASTRMTAEWVEACKEEVLRTLREADEEARVLEWQTEGWQESEAPKRAHQVWQAFDGGELLAMMVVQRIAPAE